MLLPKRCLFTQSLDYSLDSRLFPPFFQWCLHPFYHFSKKRWPYFRSGITRFSLLLSRSLQTAASDSLEILLVQPNRQSGTHFCDFTIRCRIDGKNYTTVTDFNCLNTSIFFSFIFKQSLIKICRLFPDYTVNYRNPYFMHLLHKTWSFFWSWN